MTILERTRYIGAPIKPPDRLAIFSDLLRLNHRPCRIGVVSDKPGSGKTMMILGLIATLPLPPNGTYRVQDDAQTYDLSLPNRSICPVNVVVLPPHLIDQWVLELSNTKLTFKVIASLEDLFGNALARADWIDVSSQCNYIIHDNVLYSLANHSVAQAFLTSDQIIITTQALMPTLTMIMQLHYKVFARVIMDDLDNIKSTDCTGLFTWIISATHAARFDTNVVRFNHYDDFITESINLPKPVYLVINTALSRSIKSISEYIPDNIMKLINAGNITQAIKQLNCNIDTQENIIQVICRKTQDELKDVTTQQHQLETNINSLPHDSDLLPKLNQDHSSLLKRRSVLIDKIADINQRVTNTNSNDCSICLCCPQKPTIIKCCNQIMCFECIIQVIANGNPTCPLCRSVIKPDSYTLINIDNDLDTTRNLNDLTKPECLTKILEHIMARDAEARVIICSDHDETFKTITKQTQFKAEILDGDIVDRLEAFKSGKFNILLLNSKHYGKGLNIQFANYIIMYHAMDNETETQVIGRAQRPGRVGPLNIMYLRDENEKADVAGIVLVTEDDLEHINTCYSDLPHLTIEDCDSRMEECD
ncbi:Helicase [uncultured virus]|nr:Helicase [uncultured virus]